LQARTPKSDLKHDLRVVWGLFAGGVTVTEDLLLIAVGLLVAFNIGHFATLKRCESALMALTLESQRLTSFDPNDIVSQFQEEAASIIADVVGGMRPPSMADHLGGVISQFAQMRMMKMLEAEGRLSQPEPQFEVVEDQFQNESGL
jgi:hypothetical protein